MLVSSPVLGWVSRSSQPGRPRFGRQRTGPVEQGRRQQRRGDPWTATGLLRVRRPCRPQAHQEDRHGPVLPEHHGWRPGQAGDCRRRRRGPQVRQERGQADASNARSAPSARRRGAGHLPLTAGQLAPTAPPTRRRAWWPVRRGEGPPPGPPPAAGGAARASRTVCVGTGWRRCGRNVTAARANGLSSVADSSQQAAEHACSTVTTRLATMPIRARSVGVPSVSR